MNRPDRQNTHLLEKIKLKESVSHKKPGKKTKRWRKFSAAHQAAAAPAAAEG
jgi:hypothetical protein